jgi:hypothetical protein
MSSGSFVEDAAVVAVSMWVGVACRYVCRHVRRHVGMCGKKFGEDDQKQFQACSIASACQSKAEDLRVAV